MSTNADQAADDLKAPYGQPRRLDYRRQRGASLRDQQTMGLLQAVARRRLDEPHAATSGAPSGGPGALLPSDEPSFVRVGPLDPGSGGSGSSTASASWRPSRGDGVRPRDLRTRAGGQIATLGAASEDRAGGIGGVPWRTGRAPQIDRARRGAAGRGDLPRSRNPGTSRLLGEIDAVLPSVPLLASSGILAAQESLELPVELARIEAVGPALAPERAGYEAMRVVLDSIEEGRRNRRNVIAAALRLPTRAAARSARPLPTRRRRRFDRVGAAR